MLPAHSAPQTAAIEPTTSKGIAAMVVTQSTNTSTINQNREEKTKQEIDKEVIPVVKRHHLDRARKLYYMACTEDRVNSVKNPFPVFAPDNRYAKEAFKIYLLYLSEAYDMSKDELRQILEKSSIAG